MPASSPSDPSATPASPGRPPLGRRLRELVVGRPRDLTDQSLFHRLSLIPFLAWVGLGADGLSSSAYGPEEAFKALGDHTYLAAALAVVMAGTVLLISAAYSRIIEEFPTGGGGYVVASKLLGPRVGLVSGAALLVDYVLTIAISIAAAGDALFSFLPGSWQPAKSAVEVGLILGMTVLNMRGVRESVLSLMPVFLLFLGTHLALIVGGLLLHLPELPATAGHVAGGVRSGLAAAGVGGLLAIFVRAYSLGGGTYTGIEAVSNGLPIMREPKVATARRTMLYMATSLAFTASGLLVCYLLWHLEPVAGKTMNAVLTERVAGRIGLGWSTVAVTLFSEAALLVVAAQAGFLDGPRVLANMAVDSWVPHRFAALSERLTTWNGIALMGTAALAALLYTRGNVGHLVVMYSINVFLTFSLSMFAMFRLWRGRGGQPRRRRRLLLFGAGFALCATILAVTIVEKFSLGGWVTLVVTCTAVGACLLIRRHYRAVAETTDQLYRDLDDLPTGQAAAPAPLDSRQPVAAVLVGSYGGIGIHTLLNALRTFPGYYRGVVFLSVGVLDSGEFKGHDAVDQLQGRTREMLDRYVTLAHGLGLPADARQAIGTDVVAAAERLCLDTAREFPRATFFAGKLIFQRDGWWRRVLHNETALAIQERLQWAGRTMVTLPIRVRDEAATAAVLSGAA
jgi:amino acid transporter